MTDLVFAKFSRATCLAHDVLAGNTLITTHDGQLTLMFRCGNMRSNVIVDAQLRVSAGFTRKTVEGGNFYRLYELPLVLPPSH